MGIQRRRLGRSHDRAGRERSPCWPAPARRLRVAGAAAGRAGQRRPGRRDQPGAQRQRRGPGQRRRRRRRADRRQAGGAVGDLPPDRAGGATDQIFSRSFAGGAWTTRGTGTVGGRSSARAEVQRLAELRPGPGRRGAGDRLRRRRPHRAVGDAGTRTRPGRASTATTSSPAGSTTPGRNQNKWVFAGQGRGTGGGSSVQVPSLNIHTNQDAENPSVAGGTRRNRPDASPGRGSPGRRRRRPRRRQPDQIFVERPIGPGHDELRRRHAGRHAPPAPATAASAGSRPGSTVRLGGARPEPERRPRAQRHRARHRLHRRQRRGAVGRLVRDRTRPGRRPATAAQRDGVRRQGRRRRRGATAGSTGWPSATARRAARHERDAPRHFGTCARSHHGRGEAAR